MNTKQKHWVRIVHTTNPCCPIRALIKYIKGIIR